MISSSECINFAHECILFFLEILVDTITLQMKSFLIYGSMHWRQADTTYAINWLLITIKLDPRLTNIAQANWIFMEITPFVADVVKFDRYNDEAVMHPGVYK